MPKIRVIGMKELQKALNTEDAQKAVKKIVRHNGAELQSKAQEKADFHGHYRGNKFVPPTGKLKSSIGLRIVDDGMTAEVEPMAEYAGYVEVGTRYMNAQPYLKPAYEAQSEKFRSDMQKLAR